MPINQWDKAQWKDQLKKRANEMNREFTTTNSPQKKTHQYEKLLDFTLGEKIKRRKKNKVPLRFYLSQWQHAAVQDVRTGTLIFHWQERTNWYNWWERTLPISIITKQKQVRVLTYWHSTSRNVPNINSHVRKITNGWVIVLFVIRKEWKLPKCTQRDY